MNLVLIFRFFKISILVVIILEIKLICVLFDDYIIFIYFLVYCCDYICCYILYIILLFPKGFKFQPKNYYTLLIKDINFPLGIIHTIHIPLSLLLTDCIHISGVAGVSTEQPSV